jgi:HlyD family secretion protein
MNRQRIIGIAALVVLIVAAIATQGFGLWAKRDDGVLKLYGNVDVRQVELGFRVPGRIAAIAYEEGAKVPEGAVVARLDPRTFNDAIASAAAQVAQADAELARTVSGNRVQDVRRARAAVAEQRALVEKARADLARRESLLPSGAVSQAVVTASRGEYQAALARLRGAEEAASLQQAGSRREDVNAQRARRAGAEAQVARARTDLADAELSAPSSGTLLTRAIEPGAIVGAGQTVVTLTIDRPMRVRAYVAAGDLSRISPGMAVEVTSDGNARTYRGTIGFIAPTAEFTPKTVQTEALRADLVYRLRIIVTDPDDALRQGQPVTVAIPAARPPKRD